MASLTSQNLVPFTGTLQPGQRLLKHSNGTFIPVGVTEPAGAGSTEFYKCASVDLSTHTWAGYESLFDSSTGQWSYEDTLTTGLTYYNVPPSVNYIYSSNTLIEVKSFNNIPHGTYWDNISADIQAGLYTTDNLGDTFVIANNELQVTSSYTFPQGTIEWSIVAIDNADLVDSRYQHSITLMATHILFRTESNWNTQLSWKNQRNRSFLQNEFLNCLDEDFANHIAQINRTLWTGGSTEESEIVQDTIFLPSYTEVGWGQNNGVSEGVQFNTMISNEARIRKKLDETTNNYILSSINNPSGYSIWAVSATGAKNAPTYRDAANFVPCVVIA